MIHRSISILIGGVVLLTHKKPEGGLQPPSRPGRLASLFSRHPEGTGPDAAGEPEDSVRLQNLEEGNAPKDEAMWEVGEASDDEENDTSSVKHNPRGLSSTGATRQFGEEGEHLIESWQDDGDEAGHDGGHQRHSGSSVSTVVHANSSLMDDDAKWS